MTEWYFQVQKPILIKKPWMNQTIQKTKIWKRKTQNLATYKIQISKYPNIYISKNLHNWTYTYIRIEKLIQTNVRMNICIENIQTFVFSNIFITLCSWPSWTIFWTFLFWVQDNKSSLCGADNNLKFQCEIFCVPSVE